MSTSAPSSRDCPAPDLERGLRQQLLALQLPPQLQAAAVAAVFGGGARLRPRLCLAVYAACGGKQTQTALPAAMAVELLHCASLVHDDLPCFDDAAERRGQPAVHRQFGQGLAVLAGDALIVAAFAAVQVPATPPAVATAVARGAAQLVAGQGLESEPCVDLRRYHAAKTGALFATAAVCGAAAAAAPVAPWQRFGEELGAVYQLADDLSDCDGDGAAAQPNWARRCGATETQRQLQRHLEALAPPPHGGKGAAAAALHDWCRALRQRLQAVVTAASMPAR